MLPRQHLLVLLVTPRHIRSGLLNGRAKYFKISDSLLREQACCGSRAELLLLALLLAFHQLALLGLQNPFRECYLAQALCVGLAFDRLGLCETL